MTWTASYSEMRPGPDLWDECIRASGSIPEERATWAAKGGWGVASQSRSTTAIAEMKSGSEALVY